MLSSQLGRFVRIQRLFSAIAGFSFGLLVAVLASWLYEYGRMLLPWLALVTFLSGLVSLLVMLRQRPEIDVVMQTPLAIRWPAESQLYARRGFVGFVPLYTPKGSEAAAASAPEDREKARLERERAVETLDFDHLDIEQSNLLPTIHAILDHKERLEHCWLISTVNKDPRTPGSLPYARLLAEYLRQRKGLRCEFHCDAQYAIALDDDSLVLRKAYDKVRQAFREAAELKIPPRDMVADITTGIRSMPFGMILACLHRDQDIEFVGTRYDDRGKTTGELCTIIFGFEPVVR
jgi:hypothetical protein